MIEMRWKKQEGPRLISGSICIGVDWYGNQKYAVLQYRNSKSKIVPSALPGRDDLLVPDGAWGDWIDVEIADDQSSQQSEAGE